MKDKITALIILFFFVPSFTLNAQWAKTYGGSKNDTASSVLQVSDGGYLVLGTTISFGIGGENSDIWILKLDSDGNIEWQKTYGETNYESTNNSFCFTQTFDGGFVIGGSILVSSLSHQFWIIKLSADGAIEWQNNYGDDSINYAYSIRQINDGGYIVAGDRGWYDPAGHDFLIIKLTFDGAVEWSKTFGGSFDDYPSSILQTAEGGYIVAGATASYGAGDSDIWILKLASNGMIEWQKTYGGSATENAISLQQTIEGGYIIAGSISTSGKKTEFLVLKISSDGDVEWGKTYGGNENEYAYSISQTFDGGYIIAGETRSFGQSKDILILKLNALGSIEWQKKYGGSQEEEAISILQTIGGEYIVACTSDTYGAGGQDILILKLLPNGEINSSCPFIDITCADVSDLDIGGIDSFVTAISFENLSGNVDISKIAIGESQAITYNLCQGQQSLSLSATSGGTTSPQPGTYIFDFAENVHINAYPDTGYKFSDWSGDFSGTNESISITMDSDKSIQANFSLNVLEEIWKSARRTPCFIATAAYESPSHPHVQALQDFRDKYLIQNKLGRRFVRTYYKYSPYIAVIITRHKPLRIVVRLGLLPVVVLGYSMVHFGPVLTAMMLAVTLLAPFFLVWIYRRRREKG